MPVSILVALLTKNKTFSFAFCFIILEVTSTSELIVAQLGESFFYNLLCQKVIYGDFAKSLAKAIATRETQKQAEKDNNIYILQIF